MKFLASILATLFFLQSCQTRQQQTNSSKSVVGQCDELDIVYYAKDTFAYKTIDTASINFFKELITSDNEKLSDTCEPTGQLIYKNKGQNIFVADLSTKNIKDSISCEYVTYNIDNEKYRHRLTYRHGMSIDGIYWHKVDPKGNPWTDVDSTKFHYEEIKNSR
jgi:hypothetical protein